MAVYQISKIQIRRGKANSGVEFPQLASGELGWAIDTQELFIGNGSVSEGAPLVGNTKILTIHDDILTADYSYKITTPGFKTGVSTNTPIYRPLQTRLDDRVNVADFGALGDGIHDDTDAINRAITQLFANLGSPAYNTTANRLVLEIPAGVYITSDTIIIPSYVNVIGYGIDKTIISYSGVGVAMKSIADTVTVSDSSQPRNIKISDLSIVTTSSTSAGVNLSNTRNSEFYNLKIIRTNSELTTDPTTDSVGLLLNSSSSTITANTNIFKNIIIDNFYYGIFNNQYASNNIFDIGAISNSNTGILVGNATGSNQNQFNNFKFSNITNIGVYIKNGTQNQLSNCYLSLVGTTLPQVFFATIGNTCTNITSDRSIASLVGTLQSQYYPEVAGFYSYSSNKFTVSLEYNNGNTFLLFRLPLNTNVEGQLENSVMYTINYTYISSHVDHKRQGILTVVATATACTINDEYTGLGTILSSWEDYLKLSFSASISHNTVLISSKSLISGDGGTFSYSATATS
jgi:hypothetical protein